MAYRGKPPLASTRRHAPDRPPYRVPGRSILGFEAVLALASRRYDRGLTDFLNVVDAEREQYDIEEQYATAQVLVGEQFVALCKRLGGGRENYQSIPAIRNPQPAVITAFRRLLQPGDSLK
jgi:hypothetical protein